MCYHDRVPNSTSRAASSSAMRHYCCAIDMGVPCYTEYWEWDLGDLWFAAHLIIVCPTTTLLYTVLYCTRVLVYHGMCRRACAKVANNNGIRLNVVIPLERAYILMRAFCTFEHGRIDGAAYNRARNSLHS